MIVFINFNGNPLHTLGVMLLVGLFNLGLDLLTHSERQLLWLELAAGALGLAVVGLLLALAAKVLFGPAGHAWFAAGWRAQQPAVVEAQQQQQQQQQQRWQKVVEALHRLPTAPHAGSAAELERLSVPQLRELLAAAGGHCKGCLDKADLVEALLAAGGTSGSSCCICCEDYVAGDVLRVLPCKHRFHIECVDKWVLAAQDYSRAPACPFCNAKLC